MDRHPNAWQGGTRLVSDRPGHPSHGLCASRNSHAPQHQARGQRKPHSQMGRCISSRSGAKDVSGPLARFVKKLGAASGFRTAALAGLMLLAAAASEAQPLARQVLVLQSIDRGNLVLDYFTTNFRVDVDQQVGQPCQFPSSQRGALGICRRAGTDGRRFHPIRLRGSSQAGPGRGGRGPRVGLRTQTPIAVVSGRAAPLRGRRPAIPGQRAAGRERSRRRGDQRFSSESSTTSCSCCPRPRRCSW